MKPEDLYAWREYARTVEKLCKPNAFVVARTRKIVHKARGDTSINRIIESRCSAKHYEVVTLSRADKRK
ncbi:MAG: hypothetical protein LBF56_04010, partial [Holosporales bacterium]|nr:hypothetical protein [Holosporales bacterium]